MLCNVSDVNSSKCFAKDLDMACSGCSGCGVTDLAQWAVLPVSVFLQWTEIQFGKFV